MFVRRISLVSDYFSYYSQENVIPRKSSFFNVHTEERFVSVSFFDFTEKTTFQLVYKFGLGTFCRNFIQSHHNSHELMNVFLLGAIRQRMHYTEVGYTTIRDNGTMPASGAWKALLYINCQL